MSNSLQVVAARQYPASYLYGRCPSSPFSNVFEIPEGYHGKLRLYEAPEDWCIAFEEELCPRGCDLEYFPVLNECHDEVSLYTGCDGEQCLCLDAGRYRGLVTDDVDDPITPGIGQVTIKLSIMPGPCPAATA